MHLFPGSEQKIIFTNVIPGNKEISSVKRFNNGSLLPAVTPFLGSAQRTVLS
jgi:hypothetical protein